MHGMKKYESILGKPHKVQQFQQQTQEIEQIQSEQKQEFQNIQDIQPNASLVQDPDKIKAKNKTSLFYLAQAGKLDSEDENDFPQMPLLNHNRYQQNMEKRRSSRLINKNLNLSLFDLKEDQNNISRISRQESPFRNYNEISDLKFQNLSSLQKKLSHVHPIQTIITKNPEISRLPSIKHSISEFLKNNTATSQNNKDIGKINFGLQKMPSFENSLQKLSSSHLGHQSNKSISIQILDQFYQIDNGENMTKEKKISKAKDKVKKTIEQEIKNKNLQKRLQKNQAKESNESKQQDNSNKITEVRRGRKRVRDDIYFQKGYQKIDQLKIKLENAFKEGLNVKQRQQIRNQISAQQSRIRKKEESIFLNTITRKKDEKYKQLLSALTNFISPNNFADVCSYLKSQYNWNIPLLQKSENQYQVVKQEAGLQLNNKYTIQINNKIAYPFISKDAIKADKSLGDNKEIQKLIKYLIDDFVTKEEEFDQFKQNDELDEDY